MTKESDTVRLALPEQDLPQVTIGAERPKKLNAWLEELPAMNVGETARQLYQYIQELNRLQTSTRNRFQLLEVVRPHILRVVQTLQKHYLNQPLVLPEKARRVASLAQAMQGHLANGYKLVAMRASAKAYDKQARKAMVTALHRALTALTGTLLRCYQLYFPTPRHLWLEIHQLYWLAEQQGVLNEAVEDELGAGGDSTIAQAYIRALLLATAKPNQLRQQELAVLHKATLRWAPLVQIDETCGEHDLFVFDLEADRPPIYRSHASQQVGRCRYFNTQVLVRGLGRWLEDQENATLPVPAELSEALGTHLQQVWGELTERAFKRVPETGEVELTLGLVGAHYFIAGQTPFSAMVAALQQAEPALDGEENLFLRRMQTARLEQERQNDPWDLAYRSSQSSQESGAPRVPAGAIVAPSSVPEVYACQKVNVSASGYCLSWQQTPPVLLRTGELLALRDGEEERWKLGVVRWVTQLPKGGARFGLELLTPSAKPVAVRLLKKTGDNGEFMRALLIPDLSSMGQSATLILPSVGFHSGAKVELVEDGEPRKVKLQWRTLATAGFSQYPFREVALSDNHVEDTGLSSIWSTL